MASRIVSYRIVKKLFPGPGLRMPLEIERREQTRHFSGSNLASDTKINPASWCYHCRGSLKANDTRSRQRSRDGGLKELKDALIKLSSRGASAGKTRGNEY